MIKLVESVVANVDWSWRVVGDEDVINAFAAANVGGDVGNNVVGVGECINKIGVGAEIIHHSRGRPKLFVEIAENTDVVVRMHRMALYISYEVINALSLWVGDFSFQRVVEGTIVGGK